MNNSKIQQLEFNSINYFLIRSSFFGLSINTILVLAKEFSYLSLLLGIIIGIIPILIYNYIIKNNNDGILMLNKKIFGKKIGSTINIFMSIVSFIFASMIFINLINFINSEFLKESPKLFVFILFLIPIFYILKQGIIVISRTSLILFFISILVVIIYFLGFVNIFNFTLLKPTLPNQYSNIMKSTVYLLSLNTVPLFLMTIIPKKIIKTKKDFKKKYIYSYLFTSIIIFLDLIFIVSTFGTNLASIYNYPQFNLLRTITFFGFINRILSVFSIIWIFDLFISLVMCLHFVSETVRELVSKKHNDKVQIALLIIFVFICNNSEINVIITSYTFLKFFSYIMLFTFLVIPVLISIKIKKLRKNNS